MDAKEFNVKYENSPLSLVWVFHHGNISMRWKIIYFCPSNYYANACHYFTLFQTHGRYVYALHLAKLGLLLLPFFVQRSGLETKQGGTHL